MAHCAHKYLLPSTRPVWNLKRAGLVTGSLPTEGGLKLSAASILFHPTISSSRHPSIHCSVTATNSPLSPLQKITRCPILHRYFSLSLLLLDSFYYFRPFISISSYPPASSHRPLLKFAQELLILSTLRYAEFILVIFERLVLCFKVQVYAIEDHPTLINRWIKRMFISSSYKV